MYVCVCVCVCIPYTNVMISNTVSNFHVFIKVLRYVNIFYVLSENIVKSPPVKNVSIVVKRDRSNKEWVKRCTSLIHAITFLPLLLLLLLTIIKTTTVSSCGHITPTTFPKTPIALPRLGRVHKSYVSSA